MALTTKSVTQCHRRIYAFSENLAKKQPKSKFKLIFIIFYKILKLFLENTLLVLSDDFKSNSGSERVNTLFLSLKDHVFDQEPLQGHIIQLIRLILKNYFTVRLHHINAGKSEIVHRLRQKLTKTILFTNQ